MEKDYSEEIYKSFVEKIADTALLPTKEEFWKLVEEARKILLQNL